MIVNFGNPDLRNTYWAGLKTGTDVANVFVLAFYRTFFYARFNFRSSWNEIKVSAAFGFYIILFSNNCESPGIASLGDSAFSRILTCLEGKCMMKEFE